MVYLKIGVVKGEGGLKKKHLSEIGGGFISDFAIGANTGHSDKRGT